MAWTGPSLCALYPSLALATIDVGQAKDLTRYTMSDPQA